MGLINDYDSSYEIPDPFKGDWQDEINLPVDHLNFDNIGSNTQQIIEEINLIRSQPGGNRRRAIINHDIPDITSIGDQITTELWFIPLSKVDPSETDSPITRLHFRQKYFGKEVRDGRELLIQDKRFSADIDINDKGIIAGMAFTWPIREDGQEAYIHATISPDEQIMNIDLGTIINFKSQIQANAFLPIIEGGLAYDQMEIRYEDEEEFSLVERELMQLKIRNLCSSGIRGMLMLVQKYIFDSPLD